MQKQKNSRIEQRDKKKTQDPEAKETQNQKKSKEDSST